MQKTWKIARTQAHLWIDGNYSGLSFPIDKLTPEILRELNLPPLPRKEG